MEILVIIGLILLLLVLWIISVQRKFAVMDGNIQNAMNQIGVQISSRFDALFAVLDLMKGYAADEPGKYKQKKTRKFKVYYPKERDIVSVHFRDRVFQRSLNDNILYPKISRSFIYDNMACQKGKGPDKARELSAKVLQKAWHGGICVKMRHQGLLPEYVAQGGKGLLQEGDRRLDLPAGLLYFGQPV